MNENSYHEFVMMAYTLAVVGYGGAVLLWQARLRNLTRQLKEMESRNDPRS